MLGPRTRAELESQIRAQGLSEEARREGGGWRALQGCWDIMRMDLGPEYLLRGERGVAPVYGGVATQSKGSESLILSLGVK